MQRGIELVYLEHLTDPDLCLLATAATDLEGRPVDPGELRQRPGRAIALLAHPRTEEAVFGSEPDAEPLLRASPFLAFAVAVHRSAEALRTATFTREWVGPNQRVPVFDIEVLREFLADDLRRLFLIELLASYTHVVSGSTWVRTSRGWRRRRFSELDPVRLAELLEVVPEPERPGVLRRLGDLALFLTGVFPDHTAVRGLAPVARERLLRITGVLDPTSPRAVEEVAEPGGQADLGAVGLLEALGRRWYRLAAATARPPLTATMQVADQVAERFRAARRVLNEVTERFLFPFRNRWFGMASG